MRYLYSLDDGESGEAADTGSAMHAAAAAFHQGKEVAECLESMHARLKEYTRADLHDAAQLFLKYAADTRNRSATIVRVEHPIAFSISPADEDKTQAPIQVIGKCDQVRDEDGTYKVWDIKTSKKQPMDILQQSTFQLAAYAIGMAVELKRPVHPGGIIMPRQYPRNAFWMPAWTYDDIAQILESLRHAVAAIRNGHVWHIPNTECTWCTFRTPDMCLPKLQETLTYIQFCKTADVQT